MLLVIAYTLRKISVKAAYILLAGCLIVQSVDLYTAFAKLHVEYASTQAYVNPIIDSDFMRTIQLDPSYRHILFLDSLYENDYLNFAAFALQNNMTVSDFYFARRSEEIDTNRLAALENVLNGTIQHDTIYVANSISSIILYGQSLYWYRDGNFVIGLTNALPGQEDRLFTPNSLRLLPNGGQYLQNGEDAQSERILHANGLSFGPYISLKKGTYSISIAGNGLLNCLFKVTANGGKTEILLQLALQRDDSVAYSFTLADDAQLCELPISNPGAKDVTITDMELSWQTIIRLTNIYPVSKTKETPYSS